VGRFLAERRLTYHGARVHERALTGRSQILYRGLHQVGGISRCQLAGAGIGRRLYGLEAAADAGFTTVVQSSGVDGRRHFGCKDTLTIQNLDAYTTYLLPGRRN